jgi:prevent-host-death family protein
VLLGLARSDRALGRSTLNAAQFAGSRVLLIVDRPNISGRLGDTADVSIRELRNHGGEVVDRVARGERVTVTRRGKPVAELRPLRSSSVPIAELMRRRAHLPLVDPDELRRDLDSVIDASL